MCQLHAGTHTVFRPSVSVRFIMGESVFAEPLKGRLVCF